MDTNTTPKPVEPLKAALFYLACGFSVIPILADGSKAAAIAWTPYKDRQATRQNLTAWFASGEKGIALVHGPVSGNSELLEFETEDVYHRWARGMEQRGHGDLVGLLSLVVYSPGGGVHLYYRHDDEPQGNQKLAMSATPIEGHKQGADGMTTIIETRGQGGYVLAPGCPAACHPSGRLYELAQGSTFRAVPSLTAHERLLVHSACRDMDERPKRAPSAPRQTTAPTSAGEGRPGEDFDERGEQDAVACLERHGWAVSRDHGDWQELMRPGKTRGSCSASFGKIAPGVLHVFSSNAAPFDLEGTYGPFRIVTELDFGGDFKASTRFLASRGYGAPLPPRSLGSLSRPARPAPMPERYEEPPHAAPLSEQELWECRWMVARMTALLRLSALELVAWPEVVRAPFDQTSDEIGEEVLSLCGMEVSVSRALLRMAASLSLTDTITALESALEGQGEGGVQAWAMLWQIDHLMDYADVYAEHSECVNHYQKHAEDFYKAKKESGQATPNLSEEVGR